MIGVSFAAAVGPGDILPAGSSGGRALTARFIAVFV